MLEEKTGAKTIPVLNETVESAHTGAQGSAFDVIADEVGKLADQSTVNLAKINLLIKTIHH